MKPSLANTAVLGAARADYVFTSASVSGKSDRHDAYSQDNKSSFPLSSYPAVFGVLSHPSSAINNASSDSSIRTLSCYSGLQSVALSSAFPRR